MTTLLIICTGLFIFGFLLLFLMKKLNNSFGILKGNRIYSDSDYKPGKTLYSKTLNLVGKPDYLISDKGIIFPVEVKTGKTPSTPYLNHTMQLMAYCLLVEENYGVRPTGGYLKYLDKEFKIAYTEEAKNSVKSAVNEILQKKKSGEELHCNHPSHN